MICGRCRIRALCVNKDLGIECMDLYFTFSEPVARSCRMKVYKGTLSSGEIVRVRRSSTMGINMKSKMEKELELLSCLYHRNVVCLVGVCFSKDDHLLVYEHLPNGTLSDHLHGHSLLTSTRSFWTVWYLRYTEWHGYGLRYCRSDAAMIFVLHWSARGLLRGIPLVSEPISPDEKHARGKLKTEEAYFVSWNTSF